MFNSDSTFHSLFKTSIISPDGVSESSEATPGTKKLNQDIVGAQNNKRMSVSEALSLYSAQEWLDLLTKLEQKFEITDKRISTSQFTTIDLKMLSILGGYTARCLRKRNFPGTGETYDNFVENYRTSYGRPMLADIATTKQNPNKLAQQKSIHIDRITRSANLLRYTQKMFTNDTK